MKTLIDMVQEYGDAYWEHFPPEIRAIRAMPDILTTLPGGSPRAAAVAALAATGYQGKAYPVDMQIMLWDWAPLYVMNNRTIYGVAWEGSYMSGLMAGRPGDAIPDQVIVKTAPVLIENLHTDDDLAKAIAVLRLLYPPFAPIAIQPPPTPTRTPIGQQVFGYQIDGHDVFTANMPESVTYHNGDHLGNFVMREQAMAIGTSKLWLRA